MPDGQPLGEDPLATREPWVGAEVGDRFPERNWGLTVQKPRPRSVQPAEKAGEGTRCRQWGGEVPATQWGLGVSCWSPGGSEEGRGQRRELRAKEVLRWEAAEVRSWSPFHSAFARFIALT